MYNPKPIKLRVVKNYEASTTQDQWFHSQYWKKKNQPTTLFRMYGRTTFTTTTYCCVLTTSTSMNECWYDVVHCHYEIPTPTSGEDLPLEKSVHCSYI